jgi:molybdopterin-containing oxidoreductase family iron-sulfur binding subunit
VYRPVIDTEVGTYPNVTRQFLPRPCMQCDNPPCVPVCPVRATWKREDGIVAIDYETCIGCRYCITACPYQARTFDFGENWTDGAAQGADGALAPQIGRAYQGEPNFEYGREWARAEGRSPVGNVRKCQFCLHRIEQGLLPMCATTCIGRATFFGDLNDPASLVSELASSPDVTRLKEDMGTEPKVYYLL